MGRSFIQEQKTDNPETLFSAGKKLQQLGKYSEAILCFEKLIAQKKKEFEAYFSIASIYGLLNQYEEAEKFYILAKGKSRTSIKNISKLFDAQISSGKTKEAEKTLNEAIDIKSMATAPDILARKGFIKVIQGSNQEALEIFEKILARHPLHAGASFALAFYGLKDFTIEEIKKIEKSAQNAVFKKSEQIKLHFTAGTLWKKKNSFKKAYQQFHEGNKKKNKLDHERGLVYDAISHKSLIKKAIKTFNKDFFLQRKTWGSQSKIPIFIVGMPRSGTTLAEQILSNIPGIHGAGELQEIIKLIHRIQKKTKNEYPQCIHSLTKKKTAEEAEKVLQSLIKRSPLSFHIIDKLPFNFHHLGLLHLFFPKAKVIHCVREPKDIFLSCYFMLFRSLYFTSNFQDIKNYFQNYQFIMNHWEKVLPRYFYNFHYENLIQNPKKEIQKLLKFCEIPWDPACLLFHQNPREIRTSISQVRQPFYKHSIGHWKKYKAWLPDMFKVE